MDKCIVSFVNDSSHAINDNMDYFPIFGYSDLFFGNSPIKSYSGQRVYQFPIRYLSDSLKWADWEVFLVSKS